VLSAAAPKPQQVSADALPNSAASGGLSGSEWNQAGTWEEKDTSAWVKERLTACLEQAAASSAGGSAKVSKVKSLAGEAQLVSVRKQLRHGYNFEAELSFSVSLNSADGSEDGSRSFSGVLALPELVDAVQPRDLKVEARWKGAGPAEEFQAAAQELANALREDVRSQVASFVQEYRERR